MTCPEPLEESRLHEDDGLRLLVWAVILVLLSLFWGGVLALLWLLGPANLVKLALLGLGTWLVGWALYRMERANP